MVAWSWLPRCGTRLSLVLGVLICYSTVSCLCQNSIPCSWGLPQPRSRRASRARLPRARWRRVRACRRCARWPGRSACPPRRSRPRWPSSAAEAWSSPARAAAPASPSAHRCGRPRGASVAAGTATSRSATPTRRCCPISLAAVRPPEQRLYGEPPVDPGLAAVAGAALAADGIPAERLTVVSGALDGIERVLAAHLSPGDLVAVEDPGWPGVLDLVRALGLRLAPVAVDERGMRPGGAGPALRARGAGGRASRRAGTTRSARRSTRSAPPNCASCCATCSSSRTTTSARSRACRGTPSPGASGRWATVRSVSKWLGPDLRCAVLAGDELTLARVEGRMSLGSGLGERHPAAPHRAALGRPGRGRRWSPRRARPTRAARGDGRRAGRARPAPRFAPSGLNVWVPVPDEDAAVRALLAQGVSIAAGAPFRLQTPRRCGSRLRR